mgnify:CR=1 FL=1
MWKGIAMELFHEIYSCYFDVVRRILAEAQDTPVSVKRMEEIALSHGFQETALAILPKLTSGAWPLLEEAGEKEYRSRLSQAPRTPLSSLQKSWLKALLRDRRIRLFLTDEDIARLTRELSRYSRCTMMGIFIIMIGTRTGILWNRRCTGHIFRQRFVRCGGENPSDHL